MSQQRRRDIVVDSECPRIQAQSGSSYSAPLGLWFFIDHKLQRFRPAGAWEYSEWIMLWNVWPNPGNGALLDRFAAMHQHAVSEGFLLVWRPSLLRFAFFTDRFARLLFELEFQFLSRPLHPYPRPDKETEKAEQWNQQREPGQNHDSKQGFGHGSRSLRLGQAEPQSGVAERVQVELEEQEPKHSINHKWNDFFSSRFWKKEGASK